MAAPSEGLWSDVVFHAQQATEKAMKAFLAWRDVPFRKTHNLEELGQQCVALDSTPELVAAEAAPLTEYVWKFRYPGEIAEPDDREAEAALAIARGVFSAIRSRLPETRVR
jgi:HEPN domain-containing protein